MQVGQQASIGGRHHTRHALLPAAVLHGGLPTPPLHVHNTRIFASICSIRLDAVWSVFQQAAPALGRHRQLSSVQDRRLVCCIG